MNPKNKKLFMGIKLATKYVLWGGVFSICLYGIGSIVISAREDILQRMITECENSFRLVSEIGAIDDIYNDSSFRAGTGNEVIQYRIWSTSPVSSDVVQIITRTFRSGSEIEVLVPNCQISSMQRMFRLLPNQRAILEGYALDLEIRDFVPQASLLVFYVFCVPFAWYFLMGRVAELGAAIQGRRH